MAAVLPNGKQQYFANDGLFLNGGKLYTYQAGTLTPKPTYQDAEATVENTNPIILDDRGECVAFWVGSYDITLTDALDNIIYSVPGLSEPTASYRTSATGSAIIPAGATVQRDDPAQLGYFRFNTDENEFEGYHDEGWVSQQKKLQSGVTIKTVNGESLLGSGNLLIQTNLSLSTRTSDVPITQTDNVSIIVYTTGGFTQTFDDAANLQTGLWFYTRNDTSADITFLANDALLDGLSTYISYPGETRLWQFNGTDFNTIVINPFTKEFSVSGNFVKPPRYNYFDTVTQGPGAGGGGGEGRAAGTARAGGAGGAGGARLLRRIPASALVTNSTVAIGAGGVGGVGANNGVGNPGNAGGVTSFTSNSIVLTASYGGGPGMGGIASSSTIGGSGGGVGGAGAIGAGTGTIGGQPANANIGGNSTATVNNSGGGGAGSNSLVSGSAEYGGGAGGSISNSLVGVPGGGSLYGGGSGGAGGSFTAANAGQDSTRGGSTMSYAKGTGGNNGLNGVTGVGGTNGAMDGEGGGGGGAGSAGVGGQGGAGARGAGGAGGGAGTGAAGGTGGNGGDGYFQIKGVL